MRETKADIANFQELFAWYEAGKLAPQITMAYPLADAGQALVALKNREVVGKVVISMG